MKLSIHLVTWNGAKYIPHLFRSLKNQTYKNWQLLILDNGSMDGTTELIKEETKNLGVQAELVENQENLGFAGGHNQLFERTKNKEQRTSEYILLLNQDMYLMPNCLEKLVGFMEEHTEAAAVSPRLMKWDFNKESGIMNHESGFLGKTNTIDTLGLKVFRNRRVVDWKTGEKFLIHDSKFMIPTEVFGVSGALPLFRRSAIDKVGLFDESFGSYKEDVDLAFRLRSAGYRSFVVLDAVAYHDRSAVGSGDFSDKAALRGKKNQSETVKYNSYKNHLMTLYKNEHWQNFLLDFPWILWYELKKFVYFLLFDRKVLGGLGEVWRLREELKIKRTKNKGQRTIGWREMRRWWK